MFLRNIEFLRILPRWIQYPIRQTRGTPRTDTRVDALWLGNEPTLKLSNNKLQGYYLISGWKEKLYFWRKYDTTRDLKTELPSCLGYTVSVICSSLKVKFFPLILINWWVKLIYCRNCYYQFNRYLMKKTVYCQQQTLKMFQWLHHHYKLLCIHKRCNIICVTLSLKLSLASNNSFVVNTCLFSFNY